MGAGKANRTKHHKRRHHHHHQRPSYMVLTLSVVGTQFGASTIAAREGSTWMGVQVSLGHTIGLALQFLDQHGNPMLTPVTPDAAPAWSNLVPATETLVPSADGLSAIATPVAAGTDTISVTVVVGGATFAATLDVTVNPEVQILTSVVVVPTVS